MNDIDKLFNNSTPGDMSKEIKDLIQKTKKETYEETIKYLEMNGYIKMSGTMDMSFFKEANYNAQDGWNKQVAYYTELDKKLGLT